MSGEAVELPRPFGRYTLLERLNVGGMAEVYIGSTKGIGGFEKQVAIKVIHPRYSEDRQFVQMLIQEAKLTVLLNHINIVQTFDLGREGENYFIVMEYVNGVDGFRLAKRAKKQGQLLPVDVCAYVMAEVCAGLDYAHRRRDEQGRPLNIVHRDVSPQNVLISFDGEVKVTDFGIAKAALSEEETEVGVIKGKYHYMSPEQAWGDPVDARGDVFSAGLVLYELLSGDLVYRSKNIVRLLDEVRRAEIKPPHHKRSDLPWGIVDIVMRACAKRPGDRYQSAGEMSQALREFLYSDFPQFRANRLVDLTEQLFGEDFDSGEMSKASSQSMPAMAGEEFAPDPDQSVLFGLNELANAQGKGGLRARSEGTNSATSPSETVDFRGIRGLRTNPVQENVDESFEEEKTVFEATPYGERVGAEKVEVTEPSLSSSRPHSVSGSKRPSLLARAASSLGELPSAPKPAPPPADPFPDGFAPRASLPSHAGPQPDRSAPRHSAPEARGSASVAQNAVAQSGPSPLAPVPDKTIPDVTGGSTKRRWGALLFVGASLLAVLGFLVVRAVAGPSSIMMHVVSIPHGAEVWVNGTRIRGVTPLRSLQPVPEGGEIGMEIRLAGYEPWTKRVRVANETSHVVASLRPSPAVLHVLSKPSGARVWIDNEAVGETPVPVEGLRVGQTVLVRAAKKGYRPRSETVEIAEKNGELSLELKPRK